MVTITGREHRPQSRFDTTRALLAQRRRNLLLPILSLVAVSLVAVAGVLFWSAGSLNSREALAQDLLVKSMIQIRKDTLRQLVVDYAWWDEAVVSFGVSLDDRWAKAGLPEYLKSGSRISAGWIVSPGDEVRFAFEDGRTLGAEEAPPLPQGTSELIAAARRAGSLDSVPPAGFALYGQELVLVGASRVAPLRPAGSAKLEEHLEAQNVMIFVRPLDLSFFERADVGGHIEGLQFVRGPAPSGYLACPIVGLSGLPLGSIVWYDHRPGDEMLWSAAPILLVSLLAVMFLLVLAIRQVETVVSREGRLFISLYQEQQKRSQKSDFVSMISHELRTPLQAIGTSADMLERFGDHMSVAERSEETRTIRRAVGALARLVDDVLVMGRADAAPDRDSGEPLELAKFCRAMWREVSVALRSKQKMALQDRLGEPVRGVNEVAMHTILSNLMQNAIKYSQGEGDIDVVLAREGEDYVIAVTDFGPGIAETQREAIFQPYWRASDVKDIAGTGLGLAVARSAARSMGGELILDCGGGESSGRGTRFVVRWPARL